MGLRPNHFEPGHGKRTDRADPPLPRQEMFEIFGEVTLLN